MYYRIVYHLNASVLDEKVTNKWLLSTKRNFMSLMVHLGADISKLKNINLTGKDDTFRVFIETNRELTDRDKTDLKSVLTRIVNKGSIFGAAFVTFCSFHIEQLGHSFLRRKLVKYYMRYMNQDGQVIICFDDMKNQDCRIYREADSYGLDGTPEYR